MTRTATVVQVWKCSKCEETYESPIEVLEVYCPTVNHRGRVLRMRLVDQT